MRKDVHTADIGYRTLVARSALHQPSSHTVFRVGRRVIFMVTTSLATLIIGTIGVLVIVKDAGDNHLLRSKVSILQHVSQVTT